FADFQYYYDKVPRDAKQIQLTLDRNGESIDLPITLPERWWWTDIRYRQYTVDPRTYFESRPLTEAERQKYGLKANGFASEVRHVDAFAEMTKSHQLRVGDIIVGVDGVEQDELANTAELYIKLRKTAGDTVKLDVLRDGKRMPMELKTFRMAFRK